MSSSFMRLLPVGCSSHHIHSMLAPGLTSSSRDAPNKIYADLLCPCVIQPALCCLVFSLHQIKIFRVANRFCAQPNQRVAQESPPYNRLRAASSQLQAALGRYHVRSEGSSLQSLARQTTNPFCKTPTRQILTLIFAQLSQFFLREL